MRICKIRTEQDKSSMNQKGPVILLMKLHPRLGDSRIWRKFNGLYLSNKITLHVQRQNQSLWRYCFAQAVNACAACPLLFNLTSPFWTSRCPNLAWIWVQMILCLPVDCEAASRLWPSRLPECRWRLCLWRRLRSS